MGEIGERSFGCTAFIFSPMNTYVKYTEIVIVHLLDLEDGLLQLLMQFEVLTCRVLIISKMFTIIIIQRCDINSRINKGYTT